MNFELQLFGGRGGSSGGGGGGQASALSGSRLAEELYQNKTTKMMKEIQSYLSSDKKTFLNDRNDFDEDQHWHIIDKDGTEHFLSWTSTPEEVKEIKMKNIAYISNQNGDGFWDSQGFNTMHESHDRLYENDNFRDGYDSQIERLYQTSWGKKH